ncbi:hypothetical protein RN001_009257 [Aquatica leii]|uniref:FAD dependent oxidoreductase domain-containing protein n=1 Tax=Aquatica leii TaxID=1421715 RepID=A0AAN7S829_9COLE|nr:hypothetical protein RN001_009257 [Aquatica leii]
MSDLNIAVIGAGAIGLTTALEVQKEFRNARVTVLAEKFNTDTTSFVAAGLFRPGTSFCGPTETITRKWINDSYHHWNDLNVTAEASLAGVTELSGYMFSKISPDIVRNSYLEGLLPIYRAATEEELSLCNGGWKYGSFFSTLLIECGLYLPWAANKFLGGNGTIETKKLSSLSELAGKYDAVINCTGLGAKYLCNDFKLVPIRGQVLKVHAPWCKTFFYAEFDTYIIPGFNSVTLGGCRQYDSFNLDICKYDYLSIQERCESLLPSIKSSPLIGQRVGLRPHRDPVRVEKEIVATPTDKLKVVHNYGHGGYGVTTAPGTSKHAVELLREILIGNSKM